MDEPTLLDEMIRQVTNSTDLVLAVTTTRPTDANVAPDEGGTIRLGEVRRAGDWLTGTLAHAYRGQWHDEGCGSPVLIHVAQIVTVSVHGREDRLTLGSYLTD